MLFRSTLAVTAMALVLSACATDKDRSLGADKINLSNGVQQKVAEAPNQEVKANTKGSDVICRKEKPIGSNRIKLNCYTRQELDKMAEAARTLGEHKGNGATR